MKSILSENEKAVFEVVFAEHDPDIELLSHFLTGKLIDKKSNIVKDKPDFRFLSKLKSTGHKNNIESLMSTARSLRLDNDDPPRKYDEKIKAAIVGLNIMLNVTIYVIFLLGEGPIAWYDHVSQNCDECKPNGKCTNTLNQILKERNFILPDDLQNKPIDEKAKWIFEQKLKLIPNDPNNS